MTQSHHSFVNAAYGPRANDYVTSPRPKPRPQLHELRVGSCACPRGSRSRFLPTTQIADRVCGLDFSHTHAYNTGGGCPFVAGARAGGSTRLFRNRA